MPVSTCWGTARHSRPPEHLREQLTTGRADYRIFGKSFRIDGIVRIAPFHLNRAADIQRQVVAGVFRSQVNERYGECLFPLELKLTFAGRDDSLTRRLYALLADPPWLGRWLAREVVEVVKV